MMKEIKAVEFKVLEAEDSGEVGYIEGYASTFGNVDLGRDVIERGAFAKTISEKQAKWPILLDHDPRQPIGWNIEAVEDSRGLRVKGEVSLITEAARNRYALAKRAKELGTKIGLSIGFQALKWEEERPKRVTDQPIRRLKEIKLHEYSIVLFPMNEKAGVTHAKAAEYSELLDILTKAGLDPDKLKQVLEGAAGLPLSARAATTEADPEIIQSVNTLLRRMRA